KPSRAELLPWLKRLECPGPQLPQHGTHQLHQQTAHRTRKGVPLQQVPDESQEDRDRLGTAVERDPGEDLVPEQEDEAEEEDEGGSDTS
ncbi:unnamed protein product, partial [Callosobruchus maculatus]